jgi:hypothetical protein
MVRLPNESLEGVPKNKPTKLIELLSTTFSKKIDIKEKLERLQQMGIQITEELRERMGVMCNLSQEILKEGLEQGIKQGIKQGLDLSLDTIIQISVHMNLRISEAFCLRSVKT